VIRAQKGYLSPSEAAFKTAENPKNGRKPPLDPEPLWLQRQVDKAPRRQGISKRQGWKAATFYVRPEPLAQLRRVVGLRKLEGATGDLSDAVEEALQAWLQQAEKG
jgi:hypothetical protein